VIDAGAVYESDSEMGVSRFFEKSLPYVRTSDGRTIKEILAGLGVCLKSYSTRDRIVFIAETVGPNINVATKVLTDALALDCFIGEVDIDTIKKEMMKELDHSNESFDEDLLLEQSHTSAFQGTTLSQSIYGTSSTIKDMSAAKLKDYKRRNITGSRVVFASVGDGFDKLVDKVSPLSTLSSGPNISFKQPNDFVGSEIRIRDDTYHGIKLSVGFQAPGRRAEDYYSYLLFQALLGSYDSTYGGANNSINQLAEDTTSGRKIVDYFRTYQFNYQHVGLLSVNTFLPADNIDEYTSELANRFQNVAKLTSKTELQIAKNIVKSTLARQTSSNSGLVEFIGDSILTHRDYRTLDTVFHGIDAVNIKQFKAAVRDRFDGTCPVVVAFGQIEELPDYYFLRNRFGAVFA
jgi:processing peptidase subunit beta